MAAAYSATVDSVRTALHTGLHSSLHIAPIARYGPRVPRNDPFSAAPVPEVRLANAPLSLVLIQLKFPIVAALAKLDSVEPFQKALERRYPILRPEQSLDVIVGPQGAQLRPGEGKIWRFYEKGGSWRVSLSTEFLALETRQYGSRADLVARFKEVLDALRGTVQPAVYERLGLRFVNRLKGKELSELPRLVHPELVGISATSFSPARLVHSVCETSFVIGEDAMNARWGLLPPGGTPDPGMIEAIKEPTWLLDMDAFTSKGGDFAVDAIADKATHFAERIYSFFRWSVTDEFLTRFGGTR